jgi:hypothetical protein
MLINRSIHTLVTQNDWAVSCTTGDSIDGAILHLHRSRIHGKNLPFGRWMRGNGDRKLFSSREAAWQWAYDHGYLQLYFTAPDLRMRRLQSRMNQPIAFYPTRVQETA